MNNGCSCNQNRCCCTPTCNPYIPVPGPQGVPGEAATIRVGSTITGVPGSEARVTNSGTNTNAILNFVIPTGLDAITPTISIGTTTTLPPGSEATVTNSGTSTDAIFNFGIPSGESITPAESVELLPEASSISTIITKINELINSLTNAGFLEN